MTPWLRFIPYNSSHRIETKPCKVNPLECVSHNFISQLLMVLPAAPGR